MQHLNFCKKSGSARLAVNGLLEKANAFPSCDAYAASSCGALQLR